MNSNMPVYSFLGYKLFKADIIHEKDTSIVEEFKIHIIKSEYLVEKKVYSMLIEISFKFENENEFSKMIFGSAIKINDETWLSKLEDNQKNSIFFSISFPYIRNMVSNLTDDSRGRFDLPILDIRSVDFTKGVVFKKMRNE